MILHLHVLNKFNQVSNIQKLGHRVPDISQNFLRYSNEKFYIKNGVRVQEENTTEVKIHTILKSKNECKNNV